MSSFVSNVDILEQDGRHLEKVTSRIRLCMARAYHDRYNNREKYGHGFCPEVPEWKGMKTQHELMWCRGTLRGTSLKELLEEKY